MSREQLLIDATAFCSRYTQMNTNVSLAASNPLCGSVFSGDKNLERRYSALDFFSGSVSDG